MQDPSRTFDNKNPVKTMFGIAREKINEKHSQLGGDAGFLGSPVEDIINFSDVYFRRYQYGMIYTTLFTDAHAVHGHIFDKWSALGYERSWLGLPITDELDFDGGRASYFQNGAIYWWPDIGTRELNNVVVEYTGLFCFGETDYDKFTSGDDEPYATIGVNAPDGTMGTFRTKIYHETNRGASHFDVIEIYRGKPHGLIISTVLTEWSGGDTETSRKIINTAVDEGGKALATSALAIPGVGVVVAGAAHLAHKVFKEKIMKAVNSLVEKTFGYADRPLGEDVRVLSPKDMVVLATRPEGHAQNYAIPYRFATPV